MKKKILGLLLVVCMVIGMLPVVAMAEETQLKGFWFEYWNGSGWGEAKLNQGDATVYYVQTDAGNGYSCLTTTGASADNYVVKVAYPANEEPSVYFKGVNMINPGGWGILFEPFGEGADLECQPRD